MKTVEWGLIYRKYTVGMLLALPERLWEARVCDYVCWRLMKDMVGTVVSGSEPEGDRKIFTRRVLAI